MAEQTVGEQEQERAMIVVRKAWKKTHPGFTAGLHTIVEHVFDAGFIAGVQYGQELRGCCRLEFPLTEEGIQAYIAHMKEQERER